MLRIRSTVKKYTHGSLLAPIMHENVPFGSKWLGGEGYGVWFKITKEPSLINPEFRIQRFGDDGVLHCDSVFVCEDYGIFDLQKPYKITHISHCAKCSILQNNNIFLFSFHKAYLI